MRSSRYIPVTEIDINTIDDEDTFEWYLQTEFSKFNNDKKYELLRNEKFINLLFNSNPQIFRYFSTTYFSDHKIPDILFSKENEPQIRNIDDIKIGKCLNYIINLDKFYDVFLENHNYYLLKNKNLDEYSFHRPLLDSMYEKSSQKANEFVQNHPDYISDISLYRKVQVSNPITSDEFKTLNSIKEYLKLNSEDAFYSKFSIETINSIVDSGYYYLLSDKDKISIIKNFIVYDSGNTPTLSIGLFKNKDFFKQICNYTKLDAIYTSKVMKYIENNNGEIYDKYDQLFKSLIEHKNTKTVDDLSYLYFGDYLENVKLNVEMILNFSDSLKLYKDKLDPKILSVLSNLDFDNIENEKDIERMDNYLKNSEIDFSKVIYDYVSLARETFTDELKDSLMNLNSKEEVTIEEGVKIHHYDGNPLSFVVHCSAVKQGDPKEFAINRNNILNLGKKYNRHISASYINETNINVFNKDSIIYGFNNLKDMQLVSANSEDSFSSNNSDIPVNSPSTYLNLDEFTDRSGYNELLFKACKMKPDFIVCYDKIDDYDLEMAKLLSIDIVYINSNKYGNNNKQGYFKNTNKKYIS